jgi:hypothetical protein
MALFRYVGSPTTIAPGATHYWTYNFTPIADVGVAFVTPNLLEEWANVELIAFDYGVQLDPGQGENPPLTVYKVSIRNAGAASMYYNLNTGNLL